MKKLQTRTLGCLFLFALPFAGVGVFVACLVGMTLWSWTEVQDWETVPARILEAELISSRRDSTTYRVEARYEYDFRGARYTSDRVALTFGSDNVGSFHQDAHAELSRHVRSGEMFRCYVDPDNPSRAILYRELRWGLLALQAGFALVFGGVGFGLMAGGLIGRRKLEAEQDLKRLHPDEPWRWKKEWAEGRIPAASKSRLVVAWILAVFWNLISTPLLFAVPEEVGEGNRLALIGLLFPIVGLGLAVWAVRLFIRWRKFGHSVFEMRTVPGVTGGFLEGRILTSAGVRPREGFHLTLECVERRSTGSGRNRSTSESILWQRKQVAGQEHLQRGPTGWAVPVRFGIPYGLPSTEEDRLVWRLKATAAVPGVDYSAQFEVPVFTTAQSDADFVPDQDPGTEEWTLDPAGALRAAGIMIKPVPQGKLFLFKPARHLGVALGLTLFVLIWTGTIVGMLHWGAPLMFPVLFGLFDLLLLWAVLDLWLTTSRVEVRDGTLVFSGGFLGLGRPRTVRAEEITEFKAVRGMQANNRLYDRIQRSVRGKQKYILASQLETLQLAEYLIQEFKAALPLD